MTGEFSTWLAAATNGEAVRSLDPVERATLLSRVAVHDRLEDCDAADQAVLRVGWDQAMAEVTFSDGGDWEAEDAAIEAETKAMYGEDVQWAGL